MSESDPLQSDPDQITYTNRLVYIEPSNNGIQINKDSTMILPVDRFTDRYCKTRQYTQENKSTTKEDI